jgi:putative beta-barrel porin BBP2
MKPKLFLAAICTVFLFTSISFGYKATFLPRLSVKGQYTDNILLTENKDLKEDDVITTVSPGFTAKILGKNSGAKISYDPSYAFYNEYDEFNGWRHLANLSGWSQITKHTRLDIRDNFVYTENPVRNDNLAEIRTEDPDIPIDTTVRKSRRIYYHNLASVDLNHQFGKYDSFFRIGYRYWFRDEDDPNLEDKESHTPSAGVTYWFSPEWGFDVNGSYNRGEFEVSDDVDIFRGSVGFLKRFGKHFTGFIRYSQAVVDYQGETEDDTTYNPSLGFKYDIEKDISVIADFGYFYNDYEFRESESGFNGNIRLIKLFEHGKLNLALLSGYDYSFLTTENLGFNVYYEPSASLTYRLAKHVNSNIFAAYRKSDYTDVNREDEKMRAGLGLKWQALEWMSIGVNYRFRTVDSTNETRDYDENSVRVRITLTPKQPFHTSRY